MCSRILNAGLLIVIKEERKGAERRQAGDEEGGSYLFNSKGPHVVLH